MQVRDAVWRLDAESAGVDVEMLPRPEPLAPVERCPDVDHGRRPVVRPLEFLRPGPTNLHRMAGGLALARGGDGQCPSVFAAKPRAGRRDDDAHLLLGNLKLGRDLIAHPKGTLASSPDRDAVAVPRR